MEGNCCLEILLSKLMNKRVNLFLFLFLDSEVALVLKICACILSFERGKRVELIDIGIVRSYWITRDESNLLNRKQPLFVHQLNCSLICFGCLNEWIRIWMIRKFNEYTENARTHCFLKCMPNVWGNSDKSFTKSRFWYLMNRKCVTILTQLIN